MAVWLTVATVLESVESVASGRAPVLPVPQVELIPKDTLIPEKRFRTLLPEVGGDPNDIVKLAEEIEDYVSVNDKLQAAIDTAIAANGVVETPATFELPFMPDIDIGDHVTVEGRGLGLSGDEVVIGMRYQFDAGVPDRLEVEATNLVGSIDPERFVRQG